MNKRILTAIAAICILATTAFSQPTSADVSRIYEQGERLYISKHYSESLDYLKKEGGNLVNSNDSLQYLRIKNLEGLYRSDLARTMELESSLKLFYARVRGYSFPQMKQNEITEIYSAFTSFKEKDKAFNDSVARVTDINKVESLPSIRTVTANYLRDQPNTYFNKELNTVIVNIDAKLAEEARIKKKQELDKQNLAYVKKIGKGIALNFAYLTPSGTKSTFPGFTDYNSVVSFFNGQSTGSLGEKYSLNASLADVVINLFASPRVKASILWNLFDGEYTVFDWKSNTLLHDKGTAGATTTELKTLKVGTRIGPMLSVLIAKRVSAAIYYSFRPGVQFLAGTHYFTQTNGSVTTNYAIRPVLGNFNMSSEVGLKIYFFERLFVSPFMHFGKYNWQNEIENTSNGGSKVKTQADYEMKYIGIRIGF